MSLGQIKLQPNISWDRALKYIPMGTQTLSKRPRTYINGVYPKFLERGAGCNVVDENGSNYIDYISSLGTILLGYGDLTVDSAVCRTINDGQVLLSLPHPKEAELAESLCGNFGFDNVQLFKTGSEATSAAVRLARAYTGRSCILKCGYNGWHDWAVARGPRNIGIPIGTINYTDEFIYNNLDSLKAAFNRNGSNVAAVILEPIIYDEPKAGFLDKLISLAHEKDSIVIFDEIVTGLRFGMSGAGGYFGVMPDLSCFGKALGNGYPIAGVLGHKRIMSIFNKDDFMASGTFNGDLIGISAALAVLDVYKPRELWINGLSLKMGFNLLCKNMDINASCVGLAPRTKFEFPSIEHKALFWQICVKNGVLFGHANFPTISHGPRIIEATMNVCRESLEFLKKHWGNPREQLEGDIPCIPI